MSCWFSVWVCPLMSEVLVFYYYGITINSRLMSLSVFFMCLCDPVLGVYTLLSAMSFSCIDPFIKIFYNIFLSFVVIFVLKFVLSDMDISIPTFLSFLFVWNIFFHPLPSSLCVHFFALKRVSCGLLKDFFFFFLIQSTTLHLLIGGFSPLTFLLG